MKMTKIIFVHNKQIKHESKAKQKEKTNKK